MKADRPSDTAAGVALSMIALSLDPVTRQLVNDSDGPFFEWFMEEHSDVTRLQLRELKSEKTGSLVRFLRESMAPGAALFTALRKLFVEHHVRAALDSGIDQLVILGGGYDPLALRMLRDHPETRCFELDHPATQTIKRRALESRRIATSGLSFLGADLASESIEEILVAAGFRAGAASVFVCEGVLMYLESAKVDRIFSQVRRIGGPFTRFVFTFADQHVLATDSHAMRLARIVERNGEGLRSSFDVAKIEEYLSDRGFRLTALGDRDALDAEYLKPKYIERPIRNLEFAVCADVA